MPNRKARTKAKSKFLKVPPFDFRPGLLEGEREYDARLDIQFKVLVGITLQNLNLLFEAFDIKKTGDPAVDYASLAIYLAEKYVPDFRAMTRRGRTKKQNDFTILCQLLADVETVRRLQQRANFPYSDRRAIVFITIKIPYSRRWSLYRGKIRTLQNLLAKARNPKFNPFAHLFELEKSDQKASLDVLIKYYGITRKSS